MIQPLLRFLTNLDARAVRTVIVSAALFATVALVFVMGRTTAIFDEDDAPIFQWMQDNAHSPWGLPAAIVVFTLASFLGAPQIGLIAISVVAFGPVRGAVYAWVSTMVSSAIHFQLARAVGAGALRRYGGDAVTRMAKLAGSSGFWSSLVVRIGDAVDRISKLIERNGFWSSLVVRIVPSAPPIVVNMAAGVSRMSFTAFMAGTALGIIPKIAVVAFFGESIKSLAQDGDVVLALTLAGVALGWLAVVLWARRALRAHAAEPVAAAVQEDNSGGEREP